MSKKIGITAILGGFQRCAKILPNVSWASRSSEMILRVSATELRWERSSLEMSAQGVSWEEAARSSKFCKSFLQCSYTKAREWSRPAKQKICKGKWQQCVDNDVFENLFKMLILASRVSIAF